MNRIKRTLIASLFFSMFLLIGCTADSMVATNEAEGPSIESAANENACWGQASAAFAQAGEMGYHSSNQSNPRLGLANLADLLFEAGIIEEGSMQALGAFVADAWGVTIDACL